MNGAVAQMMTSLLCIYVDRFMLLPYASQALYILWRIFLMIIMLKLESLPMSIPYYDENTARLM